MLREEWTVARSIPKFREGALQQQSKEGTCNGYLEHPFEKEDPWGFTARLFLVVK
jgi:hypothetical protein